MSIEGIIQEIQEIIVIIKMRIIEDRIEEEELTRDLMINIIRKEMTDTINIMRIRNTEIIERVEMTGKNMKIMTREEIMIIILKEKMINTKEELSM